MVKLPVKVASGSFSPKAIDDYAKDGRRGAV